VLQNPTVQTADLNGNFVNLICQQPQHAKEKKDPQQWRSRRDYFNKTTQRYTPTLKSLMKNDAEATTTKGGMIRLFEFDVKSKTTICLSLDPIA
jgi:hypothetical protein